MDIREIIARGLSDYDGAEGLEEGYFALADVLIETLAAAGIPTAALDALVAGTAVVVPREPTEAMTVAYEKHCGWTLGPHSYAAMIEAAYLETHNAL